MPLTLYYNPNSRARMIRFLLEEIGCAYELKHMDYEDGSMRSPEFLALNPMGKIPTITDGDVVVTDTVAIALYLADKYKSPNDLAPAIDDPRRGEYLRWMVFVVSSLEPAMTQKGAGFEMPRQSAGWGSYDLVIDTLKQRLATAKPFLFADHITATDVILGSMLEFAMSFDMFPKEPEFKAYTDPIHARPAFQRVLAEIG